MIGGSGMPSNHWDLKTGASKRKDARQRTIYIANTRTWEKAELAARALGISLSQYVESAVMFRNEIVETAMAIDAQIEAAGWRGRG
jgi:hypothetical protein